MKASNQITEKNKLIYQFKITLDQILPKIWRRIQVPQHYDFWDFHVAIQDAMGWTDSHLHRFEMVNPKTGQKVDIGIPAEGIEDEEGQISDWKANLSDFFRMDNAKAEYIYDFGDTWEHTIRLEKILPAEKTTYPKCIAGERACPPEDCGGPYGYVEFLESMADPDHEEHKRMKEWIGESWDAGHFDAGEVRFDNPEKRFKTVFG